ncbi:hypothetical protein [Senegalia massiliensis]|uniref:hypothetical protein n=1 Tax=Senegalia massiliensis TaxID=1720316 RepID=UPI0013EF1780|nr:hypothetical protein [Senegalia massiliensis]
MSNIMHTIKKLHKRKKINGYYEAADILTNEEKTNLIIISSILIVPIIIGITLLALSSF